MSIRVFSVAAICREAAVMVRKNFLAIVIACIPLIIVHATFVFMFPEVLAQEPLDAQPTFGVGFYLMAFVLYPLAAAMAAVRVHRIYLAGDYMRSAFDVIRLSMRELRFIGWWILFGLMMAVVMGIPVFTMTFILIFEGSEPNVFSTTVISTIASIPGYWVLARWSLVLPATAMDHQPRNLGHAWNKSRPYHKQLFVLMGVIPMVAGVLSQLIMSLSSSVFIAVIAGVAFGIFGAYQLALLSLSYRTIIDIDRARFDKPEALPANGEGFSA